MAENVIGDRRIIVEVTGPIDDVFFARVKVALKMRDAPIATKFRAMVECWSIQDINRELY